MLLQIDGFGSLFIAALQVWGYKKYEDMCVIDLLKKEETVPQFKKRVSIDDPLLTAFTKCVYIPLDNITREDFDNRKKGDNVILNPYNTNQYLKQLSDTTAEMGIYINKEHYCCTIQHSVDTPRTDEDLLCLFGRFRKLVNIQTEVLK